MLGAAQRGWKPVNRKQYDFDDPEAFLIWQGFQQHLKADALFHNTEFFTGQTKNIRFVLERTGLVQPGLRLFFVAHVLLEILLDRIIIKKYPEIPDRFYNDLDVIGEDTVSSFFANMDSQVPDRLFRMLARFKEHRYLYSYVDDERLFFALNRIMERGGQIPYPDSVLPVFSMAVAEMESTLFPLFEEFFEMMRKELR